MKLNVPIFWQRDPRWKDKKLGTSGTIGEYGCVITSMAMLCSYYGKSTDPARLNDETLKVNGFVSGNIYVWQSVTSFYPDIKNTAIKNYPTTATPVASINDELDNKRPVIAWVDLNPNQAGADHFILLIGREGNDYWANDPWYGDQVLFSKRYGDPVKFIFGHRFYTGIVPSDSVSQPQPDLQAELDKARLDRDRNWTWFTKLTDKLNVAADVDVALNEIEKLEKNDDLLREREKELEDVKKKLATLQTQFDAFQTNYNEIVQKDTEQQQRIIELEQTKYTLSKSIQELQEQLQSEDKGWQYHLNLAIKKLFGR